MNNFTIINKAEQDVAKAKEHLSVLKQKITDSKAKLEEAKADYEANVNSSSTDNSELHNLILSVDLIKVELKKAEDSLVALNNDIENAKEESKKISEEYSIAKQKTIETGNQFYDVKKKADVFKDSINKVTDNLKAKKAVYDEYINASDNSSDKVNQAKAELEALQTKYSEAVKSIKDLQDEYDRNTALIASRKNMLDKATADADEKKGLFKKKKKDKKDEQIEELNDRLKRQMAEFENFRKRTDKEKQAMFDTGAKSVIEKILPVVDNFERGLATVPEESKEDPFVDGMNRIYKQLKTELENIGVKPIEAVGQEFDPNLHNAVMQVESDEYESGVIAQELQKGYTYHDMVVRHSMVGVVQ